MREFECRRYLSEELAEGGLVGALLVEHAAQHGDDLVAALLELDVLPLAEGRLEPLLHRLGLAGLLDLWIKWEMQM